jgi:hypothetical protein
VQNRLDKCLSSQLTVLIPQAKQAQLVGGWIGEDLDLKSPMSSCEACCMVIDRDLNAALNPLKAARRTTGSFSESGSSGHGSSGTLNGVGETALQ